jgi:hypothetical protein
MNSEQHARVLELITGQPWGDIDSAICGLEESLQLALEASEEAFLAWEDVAERIGVEDEYSLSSTQVQDLSPEERSAYIARLLRSAALNYGVDAGFGGGPYTGKEQPFTPAAILRGLNNISPTEDTTARDTP